MSEKRKREAELVAFMLFDKPALQAAFRQVARREGRSVGLARLSAREIIQAILDAEFPAERRAMNPSS
jgi:hypothetical protein